MSKSTFAISLTMAAAILVTNLYGRDEAKLKALDVVNFDDHQRVIFQCDAKVRYAEHLETSPPALVILLPNTSLSVVERTLHYNRGVVKQIELDEHKGEKTSTEIKILLTETAIYQIRQSVDGLFYVDLARKAQTEVRNDQSSASGEDGDFSPAVNTALQSITLNEKDENPLPKQLRVYDSITLDVKEADIGNVLRLIAKQSKLNIVASNEVTGSITVALAGVTTREALDMVVKANGFDYVAEGEVILVKPRASFQQNELETKVYRLRYIDANNLSKTVQHVLSAQARVQVFYQNFEPYDEEKSKDAKGTLRSSTLIVTDSPENIAQLDAMVTALDVPAGQLMIEAKLIEIKPKDESQIGVKWSKTLNAQIFEEILLPTGTPHRYSVQTPLGQGGSVSYGTLSIGEYSAVLDFLDRHTNTKLVSNPRILAQDNQEAIISVGTNFPIAQVNRGVGGQGDVVTFQYRDVAISLRVTPHIGLNETITLSVNPVIEEVIGTVKAGDNEAPVTSKRTVETVVNLKNNETMVIGGLIKENSVEVMEKVWLLGDIPLLGNFFKHRQSSREQADLLIFITPRLL